MKNKILLYEELAINAFPALQTQTYDGWVLRYSKGHKENRINSIIPLYPSAIELHTKISECEKRYFSQGQPTLFKITEATGPDFDIILEKKGYEKISATYVMEMDLQDKTFTSGECILIDYPDGKWLDAYFSFNKYTDHEKMEAHARLYNDIKNTAMYARIVRNGVCVACGSLVIECGYMGLFNLVVDQPERQKGYGRIICETLLSEAQRLDAHTAYLQVSQDNFNAIKLYTKLGYELLYPYWYRKKVLN